MLIVHDGDSDGRTAAALFLQSILLLKLSLDPLTPEFKNNLESLGSRSADTKSIQLYETRSRDTIEWMKHVDHDTIIVILDLTFRQEHFEEMFSVASSVYVVDHHDGYDFAWMEPQCRIGFGKCWYLGANGNAPMRGTTALRDYFSLHYAEDKSTTGLTYSLYQHVLSNAAFNIENVKRNRERMNFKVYKNGRHESRVDIEYEPPNPENFYLDPTWVPNPEFVANVEDFDINLRKLPDSANFDAGLRVILDSDGGNNLWQIYHMLFRGSFLEVGKSFMEGASLISTPDNYLRVGDIAAIGRQDLRDYVESLKEQIHSGPKFIQMLRDEGTPNMYSFVMIKCSKYQTQIGAACLEANPGFAFVILHYEDEGYHKLSFRRNFDPKYGHVNLKELTSQLGMMVCGMPRGGGHPGSAGLRLTPEEYLKLLQFIQQTCHQVRS